MQEVKVGSVFCNLTVKGVLLAGEKGVKRKSWVCSCSCGEESVVDTYRLKSGKATRCNGCAKKASGRSQRTARHLFSRKAYNTWSSLKNRCTNPNYEFYSNYGGRGVSFCDSWSLFENFIADMGEPPTKSHSIDRIDPNKGYCKGNCRWATMEEQQNNRTNNVKLTHNGETKTLAQWSKLFGLDYEVVRSRFHRGLSSEKVLFSGDLNPRYRYTTPLGVFAKLEDVCESHSIPRSTARNRFHSKKNIEWVKTVIK